MRGRGPLYYNGIIKLGYKMNHYIFVSKTQIKMKTKIKTMSKINQFVNKNQFYPNLKVHEAAD